MQSLQNVATSWGIETEYVDATGKRWSVPPEPLAAVVAAVSKGQPPPRRRLGTIVLRHGVPSTEASNSPLSLPQGTAWTLHSSERQVASGRGPFVSPPDLKIGVYQLDVEFADGNVTTPLIMAPQKAYQGDPSGPERFWAISVQLYGVRSATNWGHGDFRDLSALIDIAADAGAAGIGLNPLHALFDDDPEQASPYAPNSRLFLNSLYIDVEAAPGFPGLAKLGLAETVQTLRRRKHVDYAGVGTAKLTGLRAAYGNFARASKRDEREEFERFRRMRGEELTRFAAFETLRHRQKVPWWQWPREQRTPSAKLIADLRISDAEELAFYEYVQWVAHRQMTACCRKISALGLPVGLYLDLAVGVSPFGADAWMDGHLILPQLSVGAPPDLLNTAGQNWDLVSYSPHDLERESFEPFRRMLDATMQYAGAVRIDHVLGLDRLFVIPRGAPGTEGTYLKFPREALFSIVALHSQSRRCIVIGEDLGTVPDYFRGRMSDWGIWSYRVLIFERHNGAFLAPSHYPRDSVVTFSTHDLPTFAGWMIGHDLNSKLQLGIDPGETAEDRAAARAALTKLLTSTGCANVNFLSVARFLASTPARLLMISMEDILGLIGQPNLPGTLHEHPNWRQRLPITLEELKNYPEFISLACLMDKSGRGRTVASH